MASTRKGDFTQRGYRSSGRTRNPQQTSREWNSVDVDRQLVVLAPGDVQPVALGHRVSAVVARRYHRLVDARLVDQSASVRHPLSAERRQRRKLPRVNHLLSLESAGAVQPEVEQLEHIVDALVGGVAVEIGNVDGQDQRTSESSVTCRQRQLHRVQRPNNLDRRSLRNDATLPTVVADQPDGELTTEVNRSALEADVARKSGWNLISGDATTI